MREKAGLYDESSSDDDDLKATRSLAKQLEIYDLFCLLLKFILYAKLHIILNRYISENKFYCHKIQFIRQYVFIS